MADKLTDNRIAEELKRFGETVKLPIDGKKRPILIKKLNHYYAKDNPPPKRGRSGFRQPKLRPAPTSELSDDSQDESETKTLPRVSKYRNQSLNDFGSNDSPLKNAKKRQNVSITETRNARSRNKEGKRGDYTLGTGSQIEVYQDEFSDNDTADESVYEVEEQSIGVNTSFNFDDTFDDNELNPSFSLLTKRKTGPRQQSKRQSSSPLTTNSYVTQSKKTKTFQDDPQGSTEHFISKSILMFMAIFFVALGLGYIYIRRDILFTPEAAFKTGTDLKIMTFGESEHNYTEAEVNTALKFFKDLFKELASRKGQFELGSIGESEKSMTKEEVKSRLKKMTDSDGKKDNKLVTLCFHLILSHPEYDVLAFDADGADATEVENVFRIESRYGDLPVSTRIYLALMKVLYGLCLLLMCIGFCILGIFYLRWQNKKKEQEQLKVYELVEKIIEILKNNSELAEKKNDPSNYPPYLAVQHVRDQLIPIAKRRQMKQLWDEAVKFIETNESRIRVDTQIIHGEEFTVWRWLPAVPNGHKVWQGQAFGETSQSNVNVLPYGPTPCLKVRNMFDANMEQNSDDWHLDIEESVLEKCKDVNGILHIFVDRNSQEGCVYIKCDSCQKAFETFQALHGWWFDGRLVTVKYLRLEHYHDRFPDSRNRKYPLKPSSNHMHSVSRPYHRSALEMT